MYVYMPGNKNAGQIRKMKIESKSFEKFQDEIYGNISNKTKFDTRRREQRNKLTERLIIFI